MPASKEKVTYNSSRKANGHVDHGKKREAIIPGQRGETNWPIGKSKTFSTLQVLNPSGGNNKVQCIYKFRSKIYKERIKSKMFFLGPTRRGGAGNESFDLRKMIVKTRGGDHLKKMSRV